MRVQETRAARVKKKYWRGENFTKNTGDLHTDPSSTQYNTDLCMWMKKLQEGREKNIQKDWLRVSGTHTGLEIVPIHTSQMRKTLNSWGTG